MQEILKSIKAFLYERTVSPLLGAFAMAWFVWNYRIVLVLLNDKATLTDKLAFLDGYFGDNHLFEVVGFSFHVLGGGHLVHGILMPAVVTWGYLYLYPKIAEPVYEHSLNVQKELKRIKQNYENVRLLSVEESRNLQKEIEQLRYKSDEEASAYRARITSLTETINALEEKHNLGQGENGLEENHVDLRSFDSDLNSFDKYAREKIGALHDGKFELSDLFGSQWINLSVATRQELGKRFRQAVERGDFLDVQLIGKGAGNQLQYEKDSGLEGRSAFQMWLNEKFPADGFKPGVFVTKNERIDLLRKITNYFSLNKLGENAFCLLFEMVKGNGRLLRDNLVSKLGGELSDIEIEHLLAELKKMGYIHVLEKSLLLAEHGNELAVNSGMTALAKKLL